MKTIFLRFGETDTGELVEIDHIPSGKTELVCPFCKHPLIAVRGKVNANHFRHQFDTCNESLKEAPEIPGWHHFHLDFKAQTVASLEKAFNPNSKYPHVISDYPELNRKLNHSEHSTLVQLNTWTGNHEFSQTAQIILGSLSPTKFANWMRSKLQDRVIESIDSSHDHSPWFRLEAQRQQSILSSTLYLNEYHIAGGLVYYKIGRTTRDVNVRLSETILDLQNATSKNVTKARVLRVVFNAGYIEKYLLHRYREFKAPLNELAEYLILEGNKSKQLKSEFTKLKSTATPYNKLERYIVTGRWRYEKKRLDSVKRGMRLTKEHGWKRGRPTGITESRAKFLSKYPTVVALLKQGKSLQFISDFTNVGRSTVQRVRRALKAESHDS
ncbi:GIY-YIG nuclease family protein [Vibrio alginolyticus]|uniref:GIY-YIG nuclease family protein n=1 Tax=Vibrio alginolyticus TaxID=663 RepID=UPI0015F560CE|nr:GIY-YIG nuclease family protein [Vibrio alginolyticus]